MPARSAADPDLGWGGGAVANASLLHIYDQPSTLGGVLRFKSLLTHIESRLARLYRLRQRALPAPFGLGAPQWVDEPRFELEYHVRHIALPKPGDWRQFCIQVSRIHARPLDLSRAPWELYVIEGLDSFDELPVGSFALLLKTSLELVNLSDLCAWSAHLHDDTPRVPNDPPPPPWFAAPPPPHTRRLLRALAQTVASPLQAPGRLARPLVGAARHWAPGLLTLAADLAGRPAHLPGTRFNAVVSPHRVFDSRRFLDAEVKAIARLARGAGAEDALLAVCGGALRRYLAGQDELPRTSLVAAVQGAHDGSHAAQGVGAGWRSVALGTEIAEPRQRLRALVQARQMAGAVANGGVCAAPGTGRKPWLERGALALSGGRPPANLTVCALPPLRHGHASAPAPAHYLCGARMTYFSAMLPVQDGNALTLSISRCGGRWIVAPTACRELLPDPEVFAQCLRDSFQEYLALVPPRQAGAKSGAQAAGARSRPGAAPLH